MRYTLTCQARHCVVALGAQRICAPLLNQEAQGLQVVVCVAVGSGNTAECRVDQSSGPAAPPGGGTHLRGCCPCIVSWKTTAVPAAGRGDRAGPFSTKSLLWDSVAC